MQLSFLIVTHCLIKLSMMDPENHGNTDDDNEFRFKDASTYEGHCIKMVY